MRNLVRFKAVVARTGAPPFANEVRRQQMESTGPFSARAVVEREDRAVALERLSRVSRREEASNE
jgi:hypothetical protein